MGLSAQHWRQRWRLAQCSSCAVCIRPGGAVAISAVLGGPAIGQMGLGFVFGPVLINSVLMLALAFAVQ